MKNASSAERQMAEGDWAFSFNVTYQNHGPYFDDRLTSDTIYVPQGTLSDSDYYIINNYLTGVADTGAQMRAFCDRFRDSEESVVIVFFGDHRPWLGEQSVTYAALGIDLDAPGERSDGDVSDRLSDLSEQRGERDARKAVLR